MVEISVVWQIIYTLRKRVRRKNQKLLSLRTSLFYTHHREQPRSRVFQLEVFICKRTPIYTGYSSAVSLCERGAQSATAIATEQFPLKIKFKTPKQRDRVTLSPKLTLYCHLYTPAANTVRCFIAEEEQQLVSNYTEHRLPSICWQKPVEMVRIKSRPPRVRRSL